MKRKFITKHIQVLAFFNNVMIPELYLSALVRKFSRTNYGTADICVIRKYSSGLATPDEYILELMDGTIISSN